MMQNSDSDNFQEAVPDSPGKSMLMKFIDCSGTDITEKVKEVNEKELEARLKEDFLIPPEEEETDESSDVKEPEAVVDLQEEEEADLEVLEISHPKVQEVLIVLDEDEDKAGFDCILEKVDSSPEPEAEPGKVAEENLEISPAVELLPEIDSKEEKVSETRPAAPISKSFEEEFSRFSSQRKATPAESEVDSDTGGGKEREGNFSADDENDEESGSENILVANSSAWSSLSLILEPQV